LVNY